MRDWIVNHLPETMLFLTVNRRHNGGGFWLSVLGGLIVATTVGVAGGAAGAWVAVHVLDARITAVEARVDDDRQLTRRRLDRLEQRYFRQEGKP